MPPRTLVALLFTLPLATASAAITPDGREIAPLPATANTPASPDTAARANAPYGNTPDWQNSLRLQVAGLAVGDLNGDGRHDLAVVTYQSHGFPHYDDWHDYVWFNVGGSLPPAPSWQSSDMRHSSAAAIADVNGDGHADLVVARGGSTYDPNVVYFGSTSGLATTPGWQSQESAWSLGMVLADLNGDGRPDLVTVNQSNSSLDPNRPMYAFLNAGSSGFSPTPSWQSAESSRHYSVAAGDLNGDGRPDLAVAKGLGFHSGAYANVAGFPATTPFWTSASSNVDRGVAIADFDGDGRQDILLGQSPLTLYSNRGNGDFTPTWQADAAASRHGGLAIADVNGDGIPDVAEIEFAGGKIWLYLSRNGALDPVPAWSYDSGSFGTAVAFGDINGDGLPDLIAGFSGQPSVIVFLNRGSGGPADDIIFANGFDRAAPN